MHRGALAMVGVVLVAAAPTARAAPRVGVIEVPEDLDRALRVALEPWGVALEVVGGPAPSGDALAMRRAAAARARAVALDGLLWVSADGDDVAMWMYDADTGELSVRSIPAARDPATAAAIALTAKAMLRQTVTAPASERFGATRRPAPTPGRLRLHTSVVARWAGGRSPGLGLGLAWWPSALRGRGGVVLGVISGPGFQVDEARLLARFDDTSVHAAARGRVALGSRVALESGLGAAVHATSLDGYAPAQGVAVGAQRTNLALEAGAAVGLALGPRAELALDATLALALRRQRYLVGGEPVLELPSVGVRIGLELRGSIP